MSARCSSCGYADCKYVWQSGVLAEAAHGASVLSLLDHRYAVDVPEDQCCESRGWCVHDGMGYERDPLEIRCVHCSEAVYCGESGCVSLADLLRSIFDHERTHHSSDKTT